MENQSGNLPTPAEIRAHLDDYVIGQDEAKKVLGVAVYNHYKRVQYLSSGGGVELKKSNIMMIGPTGSGKTHIVSTLAKALNVPFAMADATVLVGASNTVNEIEKILVKLIQNSEYDIKRAERGIIYIDEIDKLVTGNNRLRGEGIQQALLKFIEGTIANVSIQGNQININTDNILFIVGGAFVNLASLVRNRLADTKAGLLDESELLKEVAADDLAKFGLIPEFVGRLPILVFLHALNRAALVEILTKPKNSIVQQYQQMFALDNVELVFDEKSLGLVADMAVELKTGARALRTILEKSMLDIMYNVPSQQNLSKVIITPGVINKTGKPIFEFAESMEETELTALPIKRARVTTAYAD